MDAVTVEIGDAHPFAPQNFLPLAHSPALALGSWGGRGAACGSHRPHGNHVNCMISLAFSAHETLGNHCFYSVTVMVTRLIH